MSRPSLADPGTIIKCPCCGKQGRKDKKYARIVPCVVEYKRKKGVEWRAKNRPAKTQENAVTLITKKTKTKSFISMDSSVRDTAIEQAAVDEQKRAFFAAGGKIQQIPTGVSGVAPTVIGIKVQLNLGSKNRRKKLAEQAED